MAVIAGGRKAAKPRHGLLLGETAFGVLFAVGLVALSWPAARHAAPIPAPTPATRTASRIDFHVIDGDTIEDRKSGTRYRISNIDTPEIGEGTRCAAERALGYRAAAAVRTLFSRAQSLEILPTGHTDRYGRTLARVEVNGLDLGAVLMERKLARPWQGQRAPWCDANGRLIR